MKSKDKDILLTYLKSQKLTTLATCGDRPWVATVYYVIDNDLNLYLLTSPKTEHGQNIAQNDQVACNIFDSHQQVTDKKVGIQIQGTASVVNAVQKIKWLLKMWHEINPGKEGILNYQNMKDKVIDAKVYKVTPSRIKFFNEELYPEEEFKVFYL